MELVGLLLALSGIASSAAEATKYQLDNFYAGSGPKSSITTYSFDIALVGGSGQGAANPARCSASSGSNRHDGFIVGIPPSPCSSGNSDYSFAFSRVQSPEAGYRLDLTDAEGGRGSTFYPQSSVRRVQNNANPDDPDPFPNYALSDPETRRVDRAI